MADELIELLREIRPSFSDVGSRDVDTRRKQNQIDRAIALLSASESAKSEAWEFRQFDGWHPCTEPLEWYDRRAFQLRKSRAAASTQSGEPDRWVAKVRVTHKGYAMELSKYIAYALPEGIHELYAASQPTQTERPPNVEQCGCQISHAEFSPTGELKRVTIHYGDIRVAYIVLPPDGSAAGLAQLAEPRNVEGMTRAEFEAQLRVGYQHDNVRARGRGHDAPLNGLTADQQQEIAERVELSYPASAYNYPPKACPGCTAWDSGASEVHFIQGCEGCRARMAQANGTAAPQSAQTGRTHTTQPGESVMGIALRQCGDESAWRRILACNPKFADLSPSDYFPVGTVLVMPPNSAAAQAANGGSHD